MGLLLHRILHKLFPKHIFYTNKVYSNYEIGEHTYGIPKIISYGKGEKLTVGKFCSIAENVTIFLGGEHRIDWITTYPFPEMSKKWPQGKKIQGHPSSKGEVIIGNDVWIGFGATILSGVHIGDGAVIGANSVVTRNVEAYSIVAGNPAKFIRTRFPDETVEKLLKIKWWKWSEEKIGKDIETLCSAKFEVMFKKDYHS